MHRLVLFLLPAIVGCGSSWSIRDEDGDGKSILEGDCYDAPGGGSEIGPEASEVWYDGIDQNCDGLSDFDKDGDGFEALAHGGTDCWDDPDILPEEFEAINGFPALTAASVNPDAVETFYDAVDANCDGLSDFDADGDGFDTSNLDYKNREGLFGDDCYDSAELDTYPSDPGDEIETEFLPDEVNPSAADTWYDGTDQDCDGWSDYDKDRDGYDITAECNDENPEIYYDPLIPEIWYNDEDENCDGNLYDKDLDGHLHVDFGGDDCWDDYETTPAEFVVIPGFAQPTADQVFPLATDAAYDGVDGDCAGDSDFDADDDGFLSARWPDRLGVYGDDCDDAESTTYPGADDTWYDGTDSDCAGNSDYDADLDGFDAEDEVSTGTDCDDTRAAVNPAPSTNEDCGTTFDDNCDGALDLEDATGCETFYLDADDDGYGSTTTQCWCEPQVATDYDATRNDDCNDAVATTNPGATEVCDAANVDENCNGTADNNDSTASSAGKTRYYHDDDRDGYGDDDHAGSLYCDDPSATAQAWVVDHTDCDDADSGDYPGATEIVGNQDDESCDGTETCYDDDDNDGYLDTSGDTRASTDTDCTDNYEGTSSDLTTDCNDSSSTAYPGATETVADGVDQDCDGVDSCYTDSDGDNYGTTTVTDGSSLSCATGTGAAVSTDCNDASSSIYPGATETVADGVDQDCDSVDSCYTDSDNDNYGTSVVVDGSSLSCTTGTGAPVSTDCNDASSSVYPGASETVADGIDQDCDSVDSCYVDADNDNYGTTSVTDGSSLSCSTGTGAPVSTDCNDASSSIYPGASEIPGDGVDQSCDGTETCYDDDDNDGYLDATGDTRSSSDSDCADAYEGTSTDLTTDCDDTNADRNPGESEVCNDVDDDCDSSVDEGLTTYYADADGDSFGTGTADCSISGVTTGGDCDDADEWVYPGAPELCDDQKNDCADSGWTTADENNVVSYVTTGGDWADYSTSFDDATAANYTLPTSGTFYFCPGTYHTKLVGTDASVSVIGRDAATTILDNNAASGSTVSVTRGAVTLEGLTIRGGKGTTASSNTYGGGVLSNASSRPLGTPTVTLVDCVVEDNTGTRGAGVAAFGSSWMLLDGTTVQTNAATLGGGAWVATAALLEVTAGSAVSDNTATDGGGIYVDGAGDLVVEGGAVAMNTATGNGGGIYLGTGDLTLSAGAEIVGNDAADGGGVWMAAAVATCADSAIWGNTATSQGGGVLLDATAALFTATTCDFDGTVDNEPNDVEAYQGGSDWGLYALYTSTASFACTLGICTPDAD